MQVLQATMLTAVPKIQFLKLDNELCPQQQVNHWQLHGNSPKKKLSCSLIQATGFGSSLNLSLC